MVTRGYELVQLQLQTSPLQRPHGFSSPTQERWLQLLQESLSVDFERKTRGAWRQCCTAPRPGGEVTQRSLGTCGEELSPTKWFGLLVAAVSAIVYIRIEPYRGRVCGHVQSACQLSVLFTWSTACSTWIDHTVMAYTL